MSTFTLASDILNKRFYMKRFLLLFISLMALFSVNANTYYNRNTNAATDANVLSNWTDQSNGAAGTAPAAFNLGDAFLIQNYNNSTTLYLSANLDIGAGSLTVGNAGQLGTLDCKGFT